jgi:hypothetical protein
LVKVALCNFSLVTFPKFCYLFHWSHFPNFAVSFTGHISQILLSLSLATFPKFCYLFHWPHFPNFAISFTGHISQISLSLSMATFHQFPHLYLLILDLLSCCTLSLQTMAIFLH